MRNQRSQRNYIIAFLCLVLVLMGVGYAAFSSVLRINGTASITNSWCLGFDNTKTNTYQATAGLAGGSTPTGTMSYTGTPCGTNIVSHSDLSANFYQPGDRITYTLTIKNKSSVTAAIKSIKVENQSVTSNTTITKGNIIYTVNMPSSTTLSSNGETTMTIVADFQDDTSIGTGYTGETQTLSVEINGEQDDGNGGFTPTFTGSIYRYGFNTVKNGDSLVPVEEYVIVGNSYVVDGSYDSLEQCNAQRDEWLSQGMPSYYICKRKTEEIGDYTTDATTLNNSYYLKHDVENDIITASYVCFVYNNAEYCMKGGDGGASFATNTGIIQGFQSFYNLPTGENPGCTFSSTGSLCLGGSGFNDTVGGFHYVSANSSGVVYVGASTGEVCYVRSDGSSDC